MKKTILVGLCTLLPALLYGAFEDTETGARATAMGGAFVTQYDDVAAVFYNPAGLTGVNRCELSASYERLFLGLTDNSSIGRNVVAFGMPVRLKGHYWGNAGFTWNQLSLSGLYTEGAMGLSYAYPLRRSFWAGVNVNRLSVGYGSDAYTKLNPVFASGSEKSAIGIDLGIQQHLDNVTLGLALENVNEPDLGLKYANAVDRKISAGISVRQQASAWSGAVVMAGKDIRFKTGAEIALLRKLLRDRVVARGGFNIGSRDYRNVALGFGYRDSAYRIDYAFVYPLSGLSEMWGSHLLSIGFGWGNPPLPGEAAPEENLAKAPVPGTGAPAAPEKPEPGPQITPEQRQHAREMVDTATEQIAAGWYAEALGQLREADDIFTADLEAKKEAGQLKTADDTVKDGQKAKDMITLLSPVVNVSTGVVADDPQAVLLRKSVGRYMVRDADAVNMVTYAWQKWPQDAVTAGIRTVVLGSFPDEASKLKLLPGISIVDQQLQDALDLIRNGRFIQSVGMLEKVLEIEPDNILALTRMGSAYWAMGKKSVARDYWRKVLKLDPNNRDVIEFLR